MGSLGVNYLKEIRVPLHHIPMIATGGVNLHNIHEFIDSGAIAVDLGSNLVDLKSVQEGDFATIELRASAYVDKVKSVETP